MNMTNAVRCMITLNEFARMKEWDTDRFLSYNKEIDYIEEHVTIDGRRCKKIFTEITLEMLLAKWEVVKNPGKESILNDIDYYTEVYKDKLIMNLLVKVEKDE